MKRALLYIGIALATIGCAKDETTEITPTNGEVSFLAGVATRVLNDNDCVWEEYDKVGIYTSEQGEDNLQFTISDTETGALENNSQTPLYTLLLGARTYYAYYPYDSALGDELTTLEIDCTKDQSNFILWASASSNDTTVPLQFAHKFTKVQFSLSAGGVDVTSLDDATAWLTGANSTGSFDVKTGEFTLSATDKIELTIDSNNTITAYLPPTDTVANNVKLWINAQNNTFLKTFTDQAWESGSSYEYDITVGEEADIFCDANDNYFVRNAAGLAEFASLVNSGNTSFNCTLMGDIDLGGQAWTPIGDISNKYSGTFDGGGYLVSGLYIDTDTDFQGLFGFVSYGEIKNVGVDGNITGRSYVGGIVGHSISSSITSCYNTGNVTITGSGQANVGGVVGCFSYYNNDTSSDYAITSCYNTGDVTSEGSGAWVGGVVGFSSSPLISCYNTGDVTSEGSEAYVGGVVGCTSSSLISCYSCGSVSSASSTYLGGVVGYNMENTVSYCYYDTETVDNGDNNSLTYTPQGAVNGNNDDTNYCGLETSLMQGDAGESGTLLNYLSASSYSDNWQADTGINNGYPILTWQVANE